MPPPPHARENTQKKPQMKCVCEVQLQEERSSRSASSAFSSSAVLNYASVEDGAAAVLLRVINNSCKEQPVESADPDQSFSGPVGATSAGLLLKVSGAEAPTRMLQPDWSSDPKTRS